MKELSAEDIQKKQIKRQIKKNLMAKCLEIYEKGTVDNVELADDAFTKAAREIVEKAFKGDYDGLKNSHARKARIVSSPNETLTLKQGSNMDVTVEVLNDFHRAYKDGCHILSQFLSTDDPLQQARVPIDFEVPAKSNFKVTIPLRTKNDSKFEEDKVYTAKFGFVNKKGKAFGEPFEIKYKIAKNNGSEAEMPDQMKWNI